MSIRHANLVQMPHKFDHSTRQNKTRFQSLCQCKFEKADPVKFASLWIYGIGPSCFFTMYAGIRSLCTSIWYNSSLDDASMILYLTSVFIEILHFWWAENVLEWTVFHWMLFRWHCVLTTVFAGICVFNETRVFSSFRDLADLTIVCLERFWKHFNIFGNVRNIWEVFQTLLDRLEMIWHHEVVRQIML